MRRHLAPAGLVFLAITSLGWGFNWPVTKYLLGDLPPLTLRGTTGVIGALLLAAMAVVSGQSLRVTRDQWLRLGLAAVLNVMGWMVLMALALLWLPASEAALIAYTMPVWASLLAWPALTGSVGFALGTVLAKKAPLQLPPLSAAAWQIGLGCLPIALAGFAIETPHWHGLSTTVWLLLVYAVVVQFCVAYVTWFAALARLPASVAAIGAMAVPVIGVVTSGLALHEPLGPVQIGALILTLASVALATRS